MSERKLIETSHLHIASLGHAIFAAAMIIIGILGLINGDFAPIWLGVPEELPGREVLAYLCTFVSLACGIGLFLRRTAAFAARALFVYMLFWMLLIKVRVIILNPLVEVVYQNWGTTAVIVAAAWVLYVWFATDYDKRWFGFVVGDKGLHFARVLFALASIAFGLSHFFYLNLTAPLIPAWLPAHVFLAYFTGCTFLAAGVGILIGVLVRLAIVLITLQIGIFTLVVWIPLIVSGNISAFQWIEFIVSSVLTAASWVVADSCRNMSWLGGKQSLHGTIPTEFENP